jgi:hypothetical protein
MAILTVLGRPQIIEHTQHRLSVEVQCALMKSMNAAKSQCFMDDEEISFNSGLSAAESTSSNGSTTTQYLVSLKESLKALAKERLEVEALRC